MSDKAKLSKQNVISLLTGTCKLLFVNSVKQSYGGTPIHTAVGGSTWTVSPAKQFYCQQQFQHFNIDQFSLICIFFQLKATHHLKKTINLAFHFKISFMYMYMYIVN